ncbi:S-methyl-5-thioribose-1-phosphate isomerase [Synechococcus sp. MIT S1220]|uniref:S-methyl-5-thioribose-1-phosphate isomerase n=1 Tax=Synechococcus sp. MIT S1220 TaxID=3082549 RepID=UPI0039B10DFF
MPLPLSLEWCGDHLKLLDQRCLPQDIRYLHLRDWSDVEQAIVTMAVRGAPAIGVAASWGVVLAANAGENLERAIAALRQARPTAVNLGWALDRMQTALDRGGDQDANILESMASLIEADDRRLTQRLVDHGVKLLPAGCRALHHCHTGAVATAGVGTALGVIAEAHARGVLVQAWLDETRPRFQGSALSAWELGCLGVPCKVIVDGASGLLMRRGEVDVVLVGCDRVAANGDVANKIGTYNLALAARAHSIPFYVCAPGSSIDCTTPDGDSITIEERSSEEITAVQGLPVAAPGAIAWNPAFDITPEHLVTGLITEFGVLRAPYRHALKQLPFGRQD